MSHNIATNDEDSAMHVKHSIAIIAACLASIFPVTSQAQDSVGFDMMYPAAMGSVTESIVSPLRDQVAAQRGRPPVRSGPRSANPSANYNSPSANVAIGSFAPSQARRRDNMAQFVRRMRAIDAAAANQLGTIFATRDMIAEMTPQLAVYGVRTDNVVDAYAVYFVTAWQVANGRSEDPSRATMQAVKQQVAQSLAATPSFDASSDATKQLMAESLLIHTLIYASAQEDAKNDPGKMRAVVEATRRGARNQGFNVDPVTLTPNGFVPAPR
jgi:hypothetical protein